MTSLQSKTMFVPGEKRESAAGLICDGAAKVAAGVGVAVGGGVGVGAVPRVTVRLADCDALPTIAVMVTTVFAVTAEVVTVKFADVCPAGISTTGGGFATRLLVESVASIPPDGAGLFRNTVPVALLPPVTVVGLSETDWRIGGAFGSGSTVTKIDLVTPPALANTLPPVGFVETALVLIVKLAALFPAAMETLGGT